MQPSESEKWKWSKYKVSLIFISLISLIFLLLFLLPVILSGHIWFCAAETCKYEIFKVIDWWKCCWRENYTVYCVATWGAKNTGSVHRNHESVCKTKSPSPCSLPRHPETLVSKRVKYHLCQKQWTSYFLYIWTGWKYNRNAFLSKLC